MPFQSEKQRRYLWANEPEIARDWTDTYGSRIAAALGGIMALAQGGRTGFYVGGSHHAGSTTDTGGTTGDTGNGADDAKAKAIQKQNRISVSKLGAPPGMSTSTGHTPTKSKGFFGGLLGGIWDAYKTISPTYNVYKALTTKLTPEEKLQANINKGYDVNNPAEMHGAETRTGPTSGPDRGDGQVPPQYINDLYAQNVMEEDGLDIDTSTGNMQDWVQNFRLADAYRQHPGTLDKPVRYT